MIDYQQEINADLALMLDEQERIKSLLGLPQWAKLSIPKAKRTDWRTPRWLVEEIKREFAPDIDVAASADNTICKFFYNKEQNALARNWAARTNAKDESTQRKTAWCNPPFDNIAAFLQKALEQRQYLDKIVMLLPYRAGSKWFRDLVFTPLFWVMLNGRYQHTSPIDGAYYYGFKSISGELRILTKRLNFDDGPSVAAFDCCVVVFKKVEVM